MPQIVRLAQSDWTAADPLVAAMAEEQLEGGAVVHLPDLPFHVADSEDVIFSPGVLASSKNVSFDPGRGRISGTTLDGAAAATLGGVMARFTDRADRLMRALLPAYSGALLRARASFRPAEIAGRATSWRKDDTRLHVDSFPATPVGARRIVRLFTNVNPRGKPRTWRVGDRFEAVARRYSPASNDRSRSARCSSRSRGLPRADVPITTR